MPPPPRAESVILAELAAIRTAMTSGASAVEYEGRKVTYRSMTEMTRAESLLVRELAEVRGDPSPGGTRRFAQFHRGYRDSIADRGDDC